MLTWGTAVKWVGLVVIVIGTITWSLTRFNSMIETAFDRGRVVGYAECNDIHTKARAEYLNSATETIAHEAEKAMKAEAKARLSSQTAMELERKLNNALAEKFNTPEKLESCSVVGTVTDILRNASKGDFTNADGDPISSPLDNPMPNNVALPKEGGPRSN